MIYCNIKSSGLEPLGDGS